MPDTVRACHGSVRIETRVLSEDSGRDGVEGICCCLKSIDATREARLLPTTNLNTTLLLNRPPFPFFRPSWRRAKSENATLTILGLPTTLRTEHSTACLKVIEIPDSSNT